MAERTEVVIIGAGVIGTCAAWALADRGVRVIVLEQDIVASGASHANAGILAPSHSVPLAAPGVLGQGLKWLLDSSSPFYIAPRIDTDLLKWLWRFRGACNEKAVRRAIPLLRDMHRESASMYERLAGPGGVVCGFERKGVLHVFRSKKGHEAGLREAKLIREYGLTSGLEGGPGAENWVRLLKPGIVGAIHLPEDGHLDPGEFVRGLAKMAEARGASFRTTTTAVAFKMSGRKITAVGTTAGEFEADEVVLATGAWSPGLGASAGLDLPVQPGKGYSLTVRAPGPPPPLPVMLMEARVAVTPMGELVRLSGTLEMAGMDFGITRPRVEAICAAAIEYLEGVEGMQVIELWRGMRPLSPDGLPFLGRPANLDNLIIATGHSTIGMSLGPVTGRIVAELACREKPSCDLALLRPDRFS